LNSPIATTDTCRLASSTATTRQPAESSSTIQTQGEILERPWGSENECRNFIAGS
jgi:hypothetical protein